MLASLKCIATYIVGLLVGSTIYIFCCNKSIAILQSSNQQLKFKAKSLVQPLINFIKSFLKCYNEKTNSNKLIFIITPIILLTISLLTWAIIPIDPIALIFRSEIGILYVLALQLFGITFNIITRYAMHYQNATYYAINIITEIIAYGVLILLNFLAIIIKCSSMDLLTIIQQQAEISNWLCWPLLPLFMVQCTIMVISNHGTDLKMYKNNPLFKPLPLEYSGIYSYIIWWANCCNIILSAALIVTIFLGGPHLGTKVKLNFGSINYLVFTVKTLILLGIINIIKLITPNYRTDQIIALSWQRLIPISLFWLIIIAIFF